MPQSGLKRLCYPIILLSLMMLLAACQSFRKPVRKVGSLNTGTAYQVFIQDDTALVATNDGVAVIDIHQRDHPKQVALIQLKQAAFGVYAHDDLVYIAGPADGLVIADIQEPTNPKIVGTYPGSGINEVCVYDQIAYASTQQGDLHIINAEDPSKPYLLGTYSGGDGIGLMVACSQDVLYFSTANRGLDVLDVSDPSSPVKITTVSRTQGAKDAQIEGDLLFLACSGNGARVLDISNPRSPVTIASFNAGGEAWGVGGDSNYLWIGDLQEGIELYDVSNPPSPELIIQDPHYAPHDIFFDGDYAYLADQDRGFIILEHIQGE